jgi:L-asparaginase II
MSDYSAYDHPVQHAIRATASDIFALDFSGLPWGTDGCGVPNYATALADLARAYATLGSPAMLQPGLRGSTAQVFEAMTAEPYLVAGRDRFDTAAMEMMPGRLVVKGGAEGVWAAATDSGLGFAVKVHDGAKRAAEFAMAELLAKVTGVNALAAHAGRTVANVAGHKVGDIRWSAEARL